jgi:hypothetical protein
MEGCAADPRISQIVSEMLVLLEQQRKLLNGTPLSKLDREDFELYAERNDRLRDLCHALSKLS